MELTNITANELLTVLKSLDLPLKARRCMEMVGLNGEGFQGYQEIDCNQIGVKRQGIIERVLETQRLLEKYGVRKWMLVKTSKMERR